MFPITAEVLSYEASTGTISTVFSGSYTAGVVLDKTSGMLPGMTASVDVKIEGVEDAILIPVDALYQTSTIYYVNTSYNEETREYSDLVEVEVGLQTEITP